jgi:OPA family glycerol-3-phosphate transporter-like MFS transporter 3
MCVSHLYRTRLRGQITVLLITFFSYAALHVTRKSFSFAKVNLAYPHCPGPVLFVNQTVICPTAHCTLNATNDHTQLPICDSYFGNLSQTTNNLAILDTIFLFFYACGLYVAGFVEDRVDIRKALALGMAVSSLTVFGFAILAYFSIHTFWPYALLWSLNGLIQASGWPAAVSIMGSWFGSLNCNCFGTSNTAKKNRCGRGAILGAWSGNASAGNVISSWVFFLVLSNSVLPGYAPHQNGNWILAMAISAGILLFVAVLVFFMVRLPSETGWLDSGEDLHNEESDEDSGEETGSGEFGQRSLNEPLVLDYMEGDEEGEHSSDEAVSFCEALCIPGVVPYALSYMCLKLANYAMFFWLPFYLSHSKAEAKGTATNIDVISSSFDYGQIMGGFFAGWISDRLRTRAPVVVVMLLMSSVALLSFFALGAPSVGLLVVMIPVTGFLLGGPANMISSAIAADLGSSVQGSGKALATVTGIIDGTGSLGAAVGQYLVFVLANCGTGSGGSGEHCTWTPVFIMLVGCTLCAALFISRMCLRDCRKCGRTRTK